MGIVAGGTVRFRDGIIHMLFNKVWLVGLMAARAESQHIIFQKVFGFSRAVWVMAIDASFLHRIMLVLCLGHSIANILVAIKTEFIPCFQKNEFVF